MSFTSLTNHLMGKNLEFNQNLRMVFRIFKFYHSTGVTLDKVAKEINSRNIRYKLIKANRTYTLERMIKLFKENFTSYEETNLSDAT